MQRNVSTLKTCRNLSAIKSKTKHSNTSMTRGGGGGTLTTTSILTSLFDSSTPLVSITMASTNTIILISVGMNTILIVMILQVILV
ncbi:unnamed protein product [Rhizophagus irregularis]|nr:unnamed protein product [Rhizophagus irregularis]